MAEIKSCMRNYGIGIGHTKRKIKVKITISVTEECEVTTTRKIATQFLKLQWTEYYV